jgi:hypothetical protein
MKRTLDTARYIFQLAYVLTPKGREDARYSLNGESMTDQEQAEVTKQIAEEQDDFRLAQSFGAVEPRRTVEGAIFVDESREETDLIDDEEQDPEPSQQRISPEEDIANV